MNEITRTIGVVGLLAGLAWIIQTAGIESAGLFTMSPRFFLIGAMIAGAGAGVFAWTRMVRQPDVPKLRS